MTTTTMANVKQDIFRVLQEEVTQMIQKDLQPFQNNIQVLMQNISKLVSTTKDTRTNTSSLPFRSSSITRWHN